VTADAYGMVGNYRVRTTWVAILVAGVLAVAATTGVISLPGHERGDVARAADANRPFTDRGPTLHPTRVPPVQASTEPTRSHRTKPSAALLVRVTSAMTVRARPSLGARAIGTLVASSKYYHVGLTAWVETTARHGSWGRVEIPFVWPRQDGWIPLRGLARSQTFAQVHIDLSAHRITVAKFGRTQFVVPAATGASSSPTPPGEYFVTDRIPFSAGGSLGSFAFGISGIQPDLPAGWSGGDQLAIHGTSDPSSIGTSASAGCVRVSERTLDRLMPLLKLGTPVIIER
jgi:lipoprotein-anchoring transpeptidase ErfK/SrfK